MIVRLLLAASLVRAAGDAWAQARAADPDDPQEIIVTGERVPRYSCTSVNVGLVTSSGTP